MSIEVKEINKLPKNKFQIIGADKKTLGYIDHVIKTNDYKFKSEFDTPLNETELYQITKVINELNNTIR